MAAAEQPEGLVCIAPGMTAYDLYHGWFYKNGALRLASTLGWGIQMLKSRRAPQKTARMQRPPGKSLGNLAAQTHILPFAIIPRSTANACHATFWIGSIIRCPAIIGTSQDVSQSIHKINVPALHISGWYDMFLEGTIDGFLRSLPTPPLRAPAKINI